MNAPTRTAMTAVLAAAVLALSACGTTSSSNPASVMSSTSAPTTTSTATTSTAAGSTATTSTAAGMPMPAAPAGPHNQADITFAQQMTAHHRSAIAMADLAPTRAASSQVKALAAAIKAAQAPEITKMTGWLAAWAPETDPNGMPNTTASSAMGGMNGSAAMPGMMTDEQMSRLTAASGAAFDKMFLQMMVTHHQGALTMATTEKAQGSSPAALQLAGEIITSQTAQISQMQTLLKGS